MINAGGKNMSPTNIEAASSRPSLIGQACSIGDRRSYVTALIVLDADYAPGVGRPAEPGGKTLEELAGEKTEVIAADRPGSTMPTRAGVARSSRSSGSRSSRGTGAATS